jgi:hypothetical protein
MSNLLQSSHDSKKDFFYFSQVWRVSTSSIDTSNILVYIVCSFLYLSLLSQPSDNYKVYYFSGAHLPLGISIFPFLSFLVARAPQLLIPFRELHQNFGHAENLRQKKAHRPDFTRKFELQDSPDSRLSSIKGIQLQTHRQFDKKVLLNRLSSYVKDWTGPVAKPDPLVYVLYTNDKCLNYKISDTVDKE